MRSHLWLQTAHKYSGVPPLIFITCTQALHMISMQCVHLNVACASGWRGQINPATGQNHGRFWALNPLDIAEWQC